MLQFVYLSVHLLLFVPCKLASHNREPFSFFRLAIGSDFEEAYRVSFIHSFIHFVRFSQGGILDLPSFFFLSLRSGSPVEQDLNFWVVGDELVSN